MSASTSSFSSSVSRSASRWVALMSGLHQRNALGRVALLGQPFAGQLGAAELVAVVGIHVARVVKPGGQHQRFLVGGAQAGGFAQGAGFLYHRAGVLGRVVHQLAGQLFFQQSQYIGLGLFLTISALAGFGVRVGSIREQEDEQKGATSKDGFRQFPTALSTRIHGRRGFGLGAIPTVTGGIA